MGLDTTIVLDVDYLYIVEVKLTSILYIRLCIWLTNTWSIHYNRIKKYWKIKILSLTAPYPPRNISVRIVNLNKNNWEEQSGSFPEESFIRSQEMAGKDKLFHFADEASESPSGNISSGWPDFNSSDEETTSQPYWWSSAPATPESEDDFVSVLPMEYENNSMLSETEKSTAGSLSFFPVQMILNWLPPKPPTAFDGFHIHIEREGKVIGNQQK